MRRCATFCGSIARHAPCICICWLQAQGDGGIFRRRQWPVAAVTSTALLFGAPLLQGRLLLQLSLPLLGRRVKPLYVLSLESRKPLCARSRIVHLPACLDNAAHQLHLALSVSLRSGASRVTSRPL
jgi:hypothetical protein